MTEIHIDRISVQALPEGMAQKIDEIHAMLMTMSGKVDAIMSVADDLKAEIESLKADVAEDARVDRSAETAIQFILSKLDEAIQTNNSLPALRDAVRTIRAEVGSSTASLAAAVAAVPSDSAGDTGAGGGDTPPDNPTTDITGDADTGGGGTTSADLKV